MCLCVYVCVLLNVYVVRLFFGKKANCLQFRVSVYKGLYATEGLRMSVLVCVCMCLGSRKKR